MSTFAQIWSLLLFWPCPKGLTCPTAVKTKVQLESESDSSRAEAEELKRVDKSSTEHPLELHTWTYDPAGDLVCRTIVD